jgi:hypothetical protein
LGCQPLGGPSRIPGSCWPKHGDASTDGAMVAIRTARLILHIRLPPPSVWSARLIAGLSKLRQTDPLVRCLKRELLSRFRDVWLVRHFAAIAPSQQPLVISGCGNLLKCASTRTRPRPADLPRIPGRRWRGHPLPSTREPAEKTNFDCRAVRFPCTK